MDEAIALSLTAQQLDYIYRVLAQRPYAEVAELMAELARQTRDQTPALQAKP